MISNLYYFTHTYSIIRFYFQMRHKCYKSPPLLLVVASPPPSTLMTPPQLLSSSINPDDTSSTTLQIVLSRKPHDSYPSPFTLKVSILFLFYSIEKIE